MPSMRHRRHRAARLTCWRRTYGSSGRSQRSSNRRSAPTSSSKGTALSKAYKVIRRFSEDVDLTYDIPALAPQLLGGVADGIDAIPPSRSQEKKWSDEIRRELLPAWLRDHAHPVVQAGMTALGAATSRVTEDCIFIEYEPATPASSYALPRVKLEFGARSSGEPSTVLPVRSDIDGFISGVEFPAANPGHESDAHLLGEGDGCPCLLSSRRTRSQ